MNILKISLLSDCKKAIWNSAINQFLVIGSHDIWRLNPKDKNLEKIFSSQCHIIDCVVNKKNNIYISLSSETTLVGELEQDSMKLKHSISSTGKLKVDEFNLYIFMQDKLTLYNIENYNVVTKLKLGYIRDIDVGTRQNSAFLVTDDGYIHVLDRDSRKITQIVKFPIEFVPTSVACHTTIGIVAVAGTTEIPIYNFSKKTFDKYLKVETAIHGRTVRSQVTGLKFIEERKRLFGGGVQGLWMWETTNLELLAHWVFPKEAFVSFDIDEKSNYFLGITYNSIIFAEISTMD